ncbi:hypothetical protein KZ829_35600 [Actinoplanes hulinensis]|uniref:Uncharacterized protein n=1 Tax=Actinoplanes hulinensis TaxID=1144547 RepID=A0ABS7BDN8_9ACTN|nr:hypothetical protein [Actinoplanes hulinensis]MBW6439068.1 hypothetical protein [Actinoplanes hulinensis]
MYDLDDRPDQRPRRSLGHPAWRMLAGLITCLVAATTLPGPAAAAPPTWPANPNWQALVPAPAGDNVRAASVTRTGGAVTNAAGLTAQGTGSTVLTTTSANSPATIVLDFGKEVGGTPFANVSAWRATTGSSVTLRVATSEALPFLTAGSNGVYNSDNGSPVTFAVNGVRTYTGALRGGFRFAAIQLTTPGSVTLTGAGVNFKAYRATADRYQGYFISTCRPPTAGSPAPSGSAVAAPSRRGGRHTAARSRSPRRAWPTRTATPSSRSTTGRSWHGSPAATPPAPST